MRIHRLLVPFVAIPATVAALSVQPAAAQNGGMSTVGAYLAAGAATLRYDLASAARFYRIVYDRNPNNVQLAARILVLWTEAGYLQNAVPMAEIVADVDGTFEPARMVLAAEAFRDGAFDDAREHLAAIQASGLAAIMTEILDAWALAGDGDFNEALELLSETASPGLLHLFHAALIADIAGRQDTALALMSEVYEPGSSQRLTEAYARLLARSGDLAGAARVLRSFLATSPGHATLTPLLEQVANGEEIAPMVATAVEGAAELFYGIASTLIGDEDLDSAIIYLQFARYLGANGDLPTVLLGQVLQSERRHREAVEVFDSIGPDSPFFPRAAIGASVSDSIRGFLDRGAERLEPLFEANPGNIDVANTLASIYRTQERWDEAYTVLTAAIDAAEVFNESDWRLFYQRGVALERTDRWEEAEVEFQRALALSPEQPDVLNYLGYVWVDRGVNLTEALEMIERAAAQVPNSGAIIDSLGWAYYRLGDYEAAVSALEAAVQLSPDHPVILDHLADAYWRVGRTLEAQYKWAQALEESPDDALAEALRDKLENGLPEAEATGGGVFELN